MGTLKCPSQAVPTQQALQVNQHSPEYTAHWLTSPHKEMIESFCNEGTALAALEHCGVDLTGILCFTR
eukprot:12887292-Prorocentrum_lima.AAC.1